MAHVHEAFDHGAAERRIGFAFALNLAFAVVEVAGALLTRSTAVLADGLHDAGDALALALSWRLERIAQRQGDERFTFGYRRFSLLGALSLSVFLLVGGVFVVLEAVPKLLAPGNPEPRGMMMLAGAGILVNGVAAWRLHGGGSLHERLVTWHLLEDVLGWAAVLVTASLMIWFDLPILDPILSLAITGVVAWNVVRRLRQTLVVLLQGVPGGVTIGEIEDAMRAVPGVCDVHHVHVWSQDGEHHVLTGHVVIASADFNNAVDETRRRVKEELRRQGIEHATLEFESRDGPPCSDGDPACRRSEEP
ncbi:MAG: cation diffusion facilitator family transporter [Candidatus Bipolaricaulota bacterium]